MNQLYKNNYKAILKLGLPIMIGQTGIIVVGFVDTIMVGRYATDALAAASFVNVIMSFIMMLCIGFCYGITPLVASKYASGDKVGVGEILKNGIFLNLMFAVTLLSVVIVMYFNLENMGQPLVLLPLIKSYFMVIGISLFFVAIFNVFRQFFDGIGKVSTSMWVMILGNIINIIFNYFLIFGTFGFPEMGVLGAGISTLGSRVIMALLLVLIFGMSKSCAVYRKNMRQSIISKEKVKEIYDNSWPVATQMGLESGYFALCGVMMGWIGVVPLASYQIMVNVGMLGFIVYCSVAAGMAIRIAHNLGSGNMLGVRVATKCGYHIILALAALASMIFFFFGRDIIGIFTSDVNVQASAISLIIPMILYQFGDATQITYSNALRGITHVMPMMKVAFLCYIIVGIPVSYLWGFTINGAEVGIYFSFSVSLFLAAYLYRRYFIRRLRQLEIADKVETKY